MKIKKPILNLFLKTPELSRYLIFFFCIVFLLADYATPARKTMFVNLYNASSYKTGVWNISFELTELAVRELIQTGLFDVFQQSRTKAATYIENEKMLEDIDTLAAYGKENGAEIVITGVISKFGVNSTSIITPGLGGWNLWNAFCDIDFRVIDVSTAKEKLYPVQSSAIENEAGLTILGGPGGIKDLSQENVLEQLEKLKFNSELFNQTFLGKAVTVCIKSFVSNLSTNHAQGQRAVFGKVVDFEPGFVFINKGYQDNIKEGQKFLLYIYGDEVRDPDTGDILGKKEISVAEVRVVRILAARFSKAEITRTFPGQQAAVGNMLKLSTE